MRLTRQVFGAKEGILPLEDKLLAGGKFILVSKKPVS
jgi:hypothetical protein